MEIDIERSKNQTIKEAGLRSGETLIVEGKSLSQWPQLVENKPKPISPPSPQIEPGIRRREVPADNHCLFYSVYFALHEGQLNQSEAQKFRQKIAFYILDNQINYSQAVLGKTPLDYSAWIQSDASWGGSIEIRIFSDIFKIEIHATDIMTGRVDKYNEGQFNQKIMLLYDGIHYDPLYWDGGIPGLPIQTIFQSEELTAQFATVELAEKLRAARAYTDSNNFKILCGNCSKRFKGQREAVEHAEATGHFNFQEV